MLTRLSAICTHLLMEFRGIASHAVQGTRLSWCDPREYSNIRTHIHKPLTSSSHTPTLALFPTHLLALLQYPLHTRLQIRHRLPRTRMHGKKVLRTVRKTRVYIQFRLNTLLAQHVLVDKRFVAQRIGACDLQIRFWLPLVIVPPQRAGVFRRRVCFVLRC